jgi:sugar lactone lactonase YvrE
MPPVFEVAFDVRAGLGEGALWDWRHGALVSVDILAGRVLVGDPDDGSTHEIVVGQPVGAALLQREHELLLAVRDGFASVDLRDDALTEGPRVEADEPGMRMNDAACDAAGRCFAGTMEFDGSGRLGALYRLDPDLSVRPVLDGFEVSNGIGWSLSGEAMYHIDSQRHRVDVYDYDAATGTPSNGRPLAVMDADQGLPDGLTVDAEGGIWVGFWDGAALRRYSPDGALTEQLDFPAARPTKPAFGGPDLDRLYVTSATLDSGATDPGGAVFVAQPGVRGLPAHVFTPR